MKKIILYMCALLCGTMLQAQNLSQYKTLSDSAFLSNELYQKGNRYQRDAMLFVDMLTDTHPFYHKKERRDSLLQKQEALMKACATCTSDSAFTALLYGVLGKLRDKHTDLIDTTTYALMKSGKMKKKDGVQITLGEKGQVMAYGGDLFHYQLFPEHSICYLQFNQCADARTQKKESLPRWDTMIEEMFQKMQTEHINTLVVDAQYNNGGSSMLCDELLIHLCPLNEMKTFESYLRFSNLMGLYNPRIAVAKQSWDADGHHDELYPIPSNRGIPEGFVQPQLFKGIVLFIQSTKTYSSAGMLMTLARDNHLGIILGETSTFGPSHYGEILPYILPNTGVFGSISSKYFARPDKAHVDDDTLEPDAPLDLRDKEAAWKYIVDTYGVKTASSSLPEQ